jgi:hypothetical protein
MHRGIRDAETDQLLERHGSPLPCSQDGEPMQQVVAFEELGPGDMVLL